MTRAYDPSLCGAAKRAAVEIGISLHEGVYAALLGPTYETPAEIRMLRTLGADAVGMSTVPEVIALRHQRVPAAAISCITNLAAGIRRRARSLGGRSHGEANAHRFVALLAAWVRHVAAETA